MGKPTQDGATRFAGVGFAFQLVMFIIFAIMFRYDSSFEKRANPEGRKTFIKGIAKSAGAGALGMDSASVTDVGHDGGVSFYYPMFMDVHVMIFVGFGFLMTFLKRHGFGSVGLNFMVAAYVIQWALICNSAAHQVIDEERLGRADLQIVDLITADFAAGAVLVAFGAVVGRVSPLQLLVMAIILVVFYAINEAIGAAKLQAVDMGGSMYVHTFGAYFGLATSLALGRKKFSRYAGHPKNASDKNSDMFAMIGTLFLWIFWPSFTGALAEEAQKYRVVVNTLLALCVCCSSTFSLTVLFRPSRKFSMVDIQNATLAGGVAVGSACDLVIQPWGACLIGMMAALLSLTGYNVVTPFLERRLGLFDTCGVHNLHGMPGVLGGLAGVVCALIATDDVYGTKNSLEDIYPARSTRTAGEQAGYQLATLILTMAMAITGGYIAGRVMDLPFFAPFGTEGDFEDAEWWVLEEDEVDQEKHSSAQADENPGPVDSNARGTTGSAELQPCPVAVGSPTAQEVEHGLSGSGLGRRQPGVMSASV